MSHKRTLDVNKLTLILSVKGLSEFILRLMCSSTKMMAIIGKYRGLGYLEDDLRSLTLVEEDCR